MNQVPFAQLLVGVYTTTTAATATTRGVSILMPGQSILKSANSWWICCTAFSIPDTPFAQTSRHVSAFPRQQLPQVFLLLLLLPINCNTAGLKKANSNQIALHIGQKKVKAQAEAGRRRFLDALNDSICTRRLALALVQVQEYPVLCSTLKGGTWLDGTVQINATNWAMLGLCVAIHILYGR